MKQTGMLLRKIADHLRETILKRPSLFIGR
jgi:hypothetical protein